MEAPALPDKRKYSIQSGMKVYFPQVRVMKENVNGKFKLIVISSVSHLNTAMQTAYKQSVKLVFPFFNQ